jgi:HAD superfamily hydrolase (TIGR01509 family)
MAQLFDKMVYSCELGISKPGQPIYEETVKQTGFKPEELLFVDDRQVNVDAAHQAGMHSFVWKNGEQGVERLKAYLELA